MEPLKQDARKPQTKTLSKLFHRQKKGLVLVLWEGCRLWGGKLFDGSSQVDGWCCEERAKQSKTDASKNQGLQKFSTVLISHEQSCCRRAQRCQNCV
jgi:hypothetical protein